MRKPENTFITAVHKHLPAELYHMKNNNPYLGGPADVWYSGSKGDCWVEYKFIERQPKVADAQVNLSALQTEWLRGRYKEGRAVYVIVGCPTGGVILRDLAWEKPVTSVAFEKMLLDRKGLAAWIASQTVKGVKF